MAEIDALDTNTSLFFSHYAPKIVEWFADIVEQRHTITTINKERKIGKIKIHLKVNKIWWIFLQQKQ